MPYVPFYDPIGWADDPSTDTPITAEALNYIEAGVEAAMAAAEGAGGDITVDPVWAAKGDLVKGVANDSADVLSVGAQNEVDLKFADVEQSLGVDFPERHLTLPPPETPRIVWQPTHVPVRKSWRPVAAGDPSGGVTASSFCFAAQA